VCANLQQEPSWSGSVRARPTRRAPPASHAATHHTQPTHRMPHTTQEDIPLPNGRKDRGSAALQRQRSSRHRTSNATRRPEFERTSSACRTSPRAPFRGSQRSSSKRCGCGRGPACWWPAPELQGKCEARARVGVYFEEWPKGESCWVGAGGGGVPCGRAPGAHCSAACPPLCGVDGLCACWSLTGGAACFPTHRPVQHLRRCSFNAQET